MTMIIWRNFLKPEYNAPAISLDFHQKRALQCRPKPSLAIPVNPDCVIITIIMKITIQILVLTVVQLSNPFTYFTIPFVLLLFLCLLHLISLKTNKKAKLIELLLLLNLVVCMMLGDITTIGCLILAQTTSPRTITFIVAGLNSLLLNRIDLRQIISIEGVLFVMITSLYLEHRREPNSNEEPKPLKNNVSLII